MISASIYKVDSDVYPFSSHRRNILTRVEQVSYTYQKPKRHVSVSCSTRVVYNMYKIIAYLLKNFERSEKE